MEDQTMRSRRGRTRSYGVAEDESEDDDEYKGQPDWLDEDIEKLLISFLGKTNRIVTGKGCKTAITTSLVNGYQEGKEIKINIKRIAKQIPDLKNFLSSLKGINYHELAHYMYSVIPRDFKKNPYRIDKRHKQWWNTLEDARVEVLFGSVYDKAREYFSISILKTLVKKHQELEEVVGEEAESIKMPDYTHSYPSFYGRRTHLPKKLIKHYRKKFIGQFGGKTTRRAEQIVDQYILTYDPDKRLELIKELADLLEYSPPQSSPQASSVQGPPLSRGRKPRTEKILKQLAKEMGQSASGIKEQGEGQVSETEFEEVKSEQEQIENILNGKEKSEEQEELSGSGAEGSRPEEEEEISEEEMLGEATEELEELESSIEGDVQADYDLVMNTIKTPKSGINATRHGSSKLNVSQSAARLERKLETVFKKARFALRPTYIPRKRRGRLDTKQAMRNQAVSNPDYNVFKRWRKDLTGEGEMWIGLAVDSSGSMTGTYGRGGGRYASAMRTAWAISTAAEMTKNHTMVVEFDTRHEVIKGFQMHRRSVKWPGTSLGGGTNPGTALELIYSEIKKLAKNPKHCLVMVISDGHWESGESTGKTMIKQMNHEGITTAELYIDMGYIGHTQGHGAKIVKGCRLDQVDKEMNKIITDMQDGIVRELTRR